MSFMITNWQSFYCLIRCVNKMFLEQGQVSTFYFQVWSHSQVSVASRLGLRMRLNSLVCVPYELKYLL